jgi:sugar phosphate permease
VGGALSPLLVIPIQQHFGWRVSFWTFGLLGVIWAVVWYLWYRDTPREKARVGPEEIREIEEGLGPARERHSLPWSIALRRQNFWLILVMYHAYCWGAYFFVFWMPKFLRGGRGFTDDDIRMWAPLPFIFGGVATICGGLASDFLVKRIGLKWGRRAVGATGLTLSAVFMLLTMLTANKLASVLFLACAYAGSDFMLPVAWALCLDVGRKYAGAVTGSMNMAGQVGSALSSAAFGWLVQAMRGRGWSDQHAYNIILPLMAAMLLASALLWLRIDPTRQLVPEDEMGRPEAARGV